MFSIFKKWFGTSQREEIKKILEEIQDIKETLNTGFKTKYKIGDTLICTTKNNEILSINDPDNTIYSEITDDISDERLKSLFNQTEKEVSITKNHLLILKDNPDFDIEGTNVCIASTKVRIPDLIVEEFVSVCEQNKINPSPELDLKYQSLINFWLQLANSSSPRKADLLSYIKEFDMRITPLGNLIGYRRIVSLDTINKDFIKFVQESLIKIKKQKKKASNYSVYKNIDQDTYKLFNNNFNWANFKEKDNFSYIGVLNEKLLAKKNLYTSKHNQGKYTFSVPGLYKVDNTERVIDGQLCNFGSGLHGSALNAYDFGSFGDTEVCFIMSPFKATVIPTNNEGKIRMTEMFICKEVPLNNTEHIDYKEIEEFDKEYFKSNLEELKTALRTKDLSELSSVDYDLSVSLNDIRNITDLLSKRVQVIN